MKVSNLDFAFLTETNNKKLYMHLPTEGLQDGIWQNAGVRDVVWQWLRGYGYSYVSRVRIRGLD